MAENVVVPAANVNDPSQDAENPSALTPGAGLPEPQSLLIAASQRSTTGDPARVMLLKYFASNWPGQLTPPTVEVACQPTCATASEPSS